MNNKMVCCENYDCDCFYKKEKEMSENIVKIEKKIIKEEDGLQVEWFAEADKMIIDKLGDFVKKLANNYEHDYGTIVHAMAAAVGATITAMNQSDQGGITGFQASCLMWEILEKEFHIQYPSKLIRYENMLFPFYEDQFNAIPYEIWVWLRDRAKQILEGKHELEQSVVRHMQKIVDGHIPYGYKIATTDQTKHTV